MSINYEFGSDNHSGIHPDILRAIENVNKGYSTAYGNDIFTKRAVKKFKDFFGKNIEVFFVGNGTAANILGLKAVTDSYNCIFCADIAHLNVHECCGPEKFLGCKLTTIPSKDGKITVDSLESYLVGFGDPHMAQPKVVSITQSTERGTVYTPYEIKKLATFIHSKDMLLHMDGARLCNAAASLKVELKTITGDAGVDVLSFGGTKNGIMFGDAVVFFDKKFSKNFEFIRKQGMHLTSKMRYLSVQFDALLTNDLWLKNATHANKMAKLLYDNVKNIPGVKITQKVQANAVFAIVSDKILKKVLKKYDFHLIDERTGEVRWMCSYNTTEDEVLKFATELRKSA